MASFPNLQCHDIDNEINNSYTTIMKTIFEEPLQLPLVAPLMLLITFLTLFIALERIQGIRASSPGPPELFKAHERSVSPQASEINPIHASSATPPRPEVIPARGRSITPDSIRPDHGISPSSQEDRQQNLGNLNQYRDIKGEACEELSQRSSQSKRKDSLITVHRRFARQQSRAPGVLLDCTAYNNPEAQVTVRNAPIEHVGWDLNVEISGADLDMVAEDDKRFYLFYKKQFQD